MKKILLLSLILLSFSGFGQNRFWQKITGADGRKMKVLKEMPVNYQTYRLDEKSFLSELQKSKKNFSKNTPVKINLPDGENSFTTFEVYESGTLSKELIEAYPNLKTYRAYSNNHLEQASIVVSNWGIYIQIFRNGKKPFLIQPLDKKTGIYMVYDQKDLKKKASFKCFTEDKSSPSSTTFYKTRSSDNVLRRYRYAIATTGEYSQYHIQLAIDAGVIDANATDAQKKEVVLAAVTVTVDRLNTVYERDLGIQLQLVPQETDVIFLDPDTDPYDNTNIQTMLNKNTTVINNAIGVNNYDGGHLFTTYPGGGLSGLGVICKDNQKAASVTGSDNPIGDPYDIDFVAHEVGHSFDANHTFANKCGGNRNLATSVEPGSGSTIMAYAGVCAPNIQGGSDAYFHRISIDEITNYITWGSGNCAQQIDIGNTAPVVSYINYSNKYIPKSTPFMLIASATDNEGDALTYAWEEMDAVTDSNVDAYIPASTNVSGPMFRSYWATERAIRYFPSLPYILNGNYGNQWEVLPSVSRFMNFAITVRDNHAGGGQTPYSTMAVQVDDTTGPFRVTSQGADEVWMPGETKTITWDVAGTTGGNVSCGTVDILLSLDGGNHFDQILVANVPNDGSETITVPTGIETPEAYLMVKGHERYFFDLAKGKITIGSYETTCNTFSNQTAVAIPDNNTAGVESTINIPDNITLSDVNVSVNITHTYIRDLYLKLTSPQGTEVILYDHNCNNQHNIIATFDDEGQALNCGSLTGHIIPVGKLGDFNGEEAQGTWKLFVSDNAQADAGTLNSWSLELCETNPSAGISTLSVTDLNIWPNPVKESFTLSFDTTERNVPVNISMIDLSGREIWQKEYPVSNIRFEKQFSVSHMSKGIYLLRVRYGNQNNVIKLILQ